MGNSESNHCHIANITSNKVQVIISPSSECYLKDLLSNGGSVVIPGLGVLSTVSDIWKTWNTISGQSNALELSSKLRNLLEEKGFEVGGRNVADLFDREHYNPIYYYKYTCWNDLYYSDEITITILMEGENSSDVKMVQFRSSTDWTWIIFEDKVYRSRHGKMNSAAEHAHNFVPLLCR